MKVLVDTAVWSLALRRRAAADVNEVASELRRLIVGYRVLMIGSVRQEILSGIREEAQYDRLRERLRAFPDLALQSADYELAAACFNRCRRQGIQRSNTDFLICAAAMRRRVAVFSTDRDFETYEQVLGVSRHRIGG